MFRKSKRKDQGADAPPDMWGVERKPPAMARVEEAADALPPDARRRRYAAMLALLALCVASLVGLAALRTCSANSSDPAQATPPAEELEGTSEQNGTEKTNAASSRYINLNSWEFLGDSSKDSFVFEMDAALQEAGVDADEPVMLYTRIESDGPTWTAFASCPNGQTFWKVVFDAGDKTFVIDKLDAMPEGLPEINYEIVEAEEEAATREPVHSTGSSSPAEAESENARSLVPVDDADTLASLLPVEAASALRTALDEWLSGKDAQIDVANCYLDPSTLTIDGENTSFGVVGEAYLDCEWNPTARRFGIAWAS